MAKHKIVSVAGKLSTKSIDSERRIVFVASYNDEDRHYERGDVASLRLPLKSGGDITVSANSKREIAQDMLTLLEEGHLSNAFSITMIDYDYNMDSETISKAEVIEVSLVYRGSNKETRLHAIKSLLGGEMPKAKQNDNFGDANGGGKDHMVAPEAPAEPEMTNETPNEPATPEAPKAEEHAKNSKEVFSSSGILGLDSLETPLIVLIQWQSERIYKSAASNLSR